MNRKGVVFGALGVFALSGTAAFAALVLGYARGYRGALGTVWNLRGIAECLDASRVPTAERDRAGWSAEGNRSGWVYKDGDFRGQPVTSWGSTFFANPFRGVPVLDAVGDRLERRSTVNVAAWRPPGY